MTNFVGRDLELLLMHELWESRQAHLMVLYGRRRVGKTTLLAEWMRRKKESDPQARIIFWVADRDNAESHLRQFSRAIYRCAYPSAPTPENFSYDHWDDIWQQLAHLSKEGRLAVIMDEFTYAMGANPALASNLQNNWDHVLKDSNIFLCLSGSHLGMIQDEVLSGKGALYGRATKKVKLQPLPFGLTASYFPDYSAEERVRLYSVFGGIPQYWRYVNPSEDVAWNVQRQVLSVGGALEDEAIFLLQESVKEPQNYISILKAIANGKFKPSEIEAYTGIRSTHTSQYLNNLMEMGIVNRLYPVTAPDNSRLGRHVITDPFLRFYYRFVASRLSQIASGQTQQALAEFHRHWVDFIGTHTWEEICREWVLRASNHPDILPVFPDRIGSVWTTEAQIDIVGINYMTKELVLGECKWTAEREKVSVLQALMESKTAKVIPSGKWRVYYLGFSKEGWNEHAIAYAALINQTLPVGEAKNAQWIVAGVHLLSLSDVDQDMMEWT